METCYDPYAIHTYHLLLLMCTGAVKITPAHDPNDFATGKRHNLASINILTPDGAINDCGGQFAGQPRFKVGFCSSDQALVACHSPCKKLLLLHLQIRVIIECSRGRQ